MHDGPAAPGTTPATQKLKAAHRAVDELLHEHRDLLADPLATELRKLHDQLSEKLCPYPARELDARVKVLNEQSPDYEVWYVRCGTTVTWCDRRRTPSA